MQSSFACQKTHFVPSFGGCDQGALGWGGLWRVAGCGVGGDYSIYQWRRNEWHVKLSTEKGGEHRPLSVSVNWGQVAEHICQLWEG